MQVARCDPTATRSTAAGRAAISGLGVVLAAFVLLVFAVTLVKLGEGDTMMEGFDHQPRASLLPKIEEESAQ